MPVTLTPTKDTGTTTQPGTHVLVEPERDSTARATHDPMPDTGLNGPFIADLLSAALTHERCGVHLYRSAVARSANPVLKSKYEDFERDTLRHVEILESTIAAMGGDPQYVSPMARAVEGMNTHLLESTLTLNGSIDVMGQEMVLLDAVLLAETIDHANWSNLEQLVDHLPEGDARTALSGAVARVEDNEDEHLRWAKETKAKLTLMMARSEGTPKVGSTVEELTAKVKSWFS